MKIFAALVIAAFAVMVLAAPALASEVGLEFRNRATGNDYGTQTNPVEMCSGPLTAKEALVRISNMGPNTDTYKVYLQDMPAGWTGEVQTDVMLASGESKNLDLFYVNTYYTAPGTYFFTIKVVSGTDQSDTAMKRLQVDILPCYSLVLSADSIRKETCSERGEEANYTLSLRNTGKFKDTFDISVPSPARAGIASIQLEPEQGTSFVVTIPSTGLQGEQSFAVIARGRLTQAAANATLGLNVKDCFSFNASIEPISQSGCVGKPAQFKLNIRNTGNGDSYELSLPTWASAGETKFSLDRDASKEITITATPAAQGKLSLDVIVKSADMPSEKKLSAEFDVTECRDIVTIASPASATVCRGEMTSYDITVKNRGVLEDTITLSATNGSLDRNKVVLGSGQSTTLKLNVDTSGMPAGKSVIEVTAGDGKVSDKSVVEVNVENCYSSKIEVTPENKTVCPPSAFNYTIKLTNTGKQDDTYVMTFRDVGQNASLASGQSVSWEVPIIVDESGAYALTATARSQNSESSATAVLVVQSRGKCYAVEVQTEKVMRANANEAKTFKITVKNTGTAADTYQIAVEGPAWAYVVPNSTSLEPGVSADAYLYVTPTLDADNTSAKLTVKVTSANAAGSTDVKVLVGNAQDDSLGGISFGNLTGAFLFDLGDRPFWKVAAIAIIVIAIIVILVVRFVLLVK
jgi:uncharacterized membrane protein